MPTRALQYDLFGDIEAAEKAERAADAAASAAASPAASAFLTETPWPALLAWWQHSDAIEARLDHGEVKACFRRGPGANPGWAWAVWRDGLRLESAETWQGWHQRPRWCIPWSQLRGMRDRHPAVTAQVRALAAGRGHPTSVGWRWWTDPHALRPDGLHMSCLEREQQADWYDGCARPDTAYADRLHAWQLVLEAISTATLHVHAVHR
ncbi:hypothetical protein [Mycolicibacterium mageritense]|uniref:hypothetical protein n=1 Tax=Mycolicibacterium mageritense TaxID=53462 RepID=UPI0011D667A9|nr:hypothetical protein [Mycolicibacterium mageritense]TXI56479.1 MAG: hypothetical protein E6Q55_28860 [Mycolicibacterium mageritense]